MRPSSGFLLFTGALLCLLGLLGGHAIRAREAASPHLLEKRNLVARLELTDLCLFTDARYTRHPALTDMNSAFQDLPMAFEHFPSGSLLPPPRHLRQHGTY